MRNIVSQYNEAIEPDLVDVKNRVDRLDEQLSENKQFVAQVKALRDSFESQKPPPDLISKVAQTGTFLEYYNRTKKRTFPSNQAPAPSHKENVAPRF